MDTQQAAPESIEQTVKQLREQVITLQKRIDQFGEQTAVTIWRVDFSPPLSMDAPPSEQFRAVFEDTIIREGNDALAQLYGYKKAHEVIGRPLRNFFTPSSPENITGVKDLVENAFHLENTITHEKHPSGHFFYALNNVRPHILNNRLFYIWGTSVNITELITTQHKLKESEQNLKNEQIKLERKNIALKEVIEQIESDKHEIRSHLQANIDKVILPFFDKLKLNGGSRILIEQCRKSLEDISAPFGYRISDSRIKLSAREMEVCSLVKNGNSNKEIADLLNIALHTVEKHRRSARKKLGLANSKTNLAIYFNSF